MKEKSLKIVAEVDTNFFAVVTEDDNDYEEIIYLYKRYLNRKDDGSDEEYWS